MDLIAVVASILIKPSYQSYKLPNKTVVYPKTVDKEEKIKKVINDFKSGLGIADTIEYDSNY